MAVALSSSCTVICSPGSSQICAPPIEAAWGEQVTAVSSVMVPASSASITSSRVMILVMEAGGIGVSGSFSKRTRPEVCSIKIAD